MSLLHCTRGYSLTEISDLATELGMFTQTVKWNGSSEIPVPSVVNWKLGHYAAITAKEGELYRLKDLTFGFDNFVTGDAIRTEASGYFLVASPTPPIGFQTVSASEGHQVFGRGNPDLDMPNQLTPDDLQLPEDGCGESNGMAFYTVHAMMVSLHVEDTPVGYTPPFGPKVDVTIGYNERETLQPANLNYTNFGRQWTHNWNGSVRIMRTTRQPSSFVAVEAKTIP
jgi:hypothetical protein